MTQALSSKADLLAFGAVAVVKRDVTVGDDTRAMYFRELTGEGMKLFMGMQESADFAINEMAEIVAMALCNAEGERQFTSDEDIIELRQMKWKTLSAIFHVAMKVIKLTKEAVDDEKKG